MGKSTEISKASKSNVVLLKEEGYKNCEIARRLSLSEASVCRILCRYKKQESFSPKKRTGRPRKTTARTDRTIKRICQVKPSISSSEIHRSLPILSDVSLRTIRRRLNKDLGLPARKPSEKPLLTPRMANQRLSFCQRYLHWTAEDWRKVMFSDESTFLQYASYKPFVRRPSGSSPFDTRYIQATVKHPPSVMVWGCFSSQGRGGLYFLPTGQTMNAKRYIDILESHLLTFMKIQGCTTFQQDSAPCHKAKVAMTWFEKKKVKVLQWPGNYPDLNPIENLWTIVKQKVSKMNPSSLDELKTVIKNVWCKEIDQNMCKNLLDSMPNRILHVIKNKRYHTKY